MLKRFASLSVFALVAACTGSVSLGKAPAASTPGAGSGVDGSTATGPWGITCNVAWRKAGTPDNLQSQTFTAKSDATTKQTIAYPDATVDFDLAPAPDSADEALLTVTTPTQKSIQVYRISRTRRPVAQFIGGHGFTGLVYVNEQDLQYMCEADGSTGPAEQANPVPLDVVCQIELRTTPGGTLEQRDTMTYTPDVAGKSPDKHESLDYEGDVDFFMSARDDAFDGRSITVGFNRGPMIPGGTGGIHTLFQLSRNAVLLNHLVGASFTGRVVITTSSNKELSYTCSARSSTTGGGDDPTCNTHSADASRETLPKGACTVPGATCAFSAGSIAFCNEPNTQLYPTTPAQYNCICTDGTWKCDTVFPGKGLSVCPGAESGATCSNGSNTCTTAYCKTDEVCFTQVSCGPAGNPACTLGSTARADNTCHRSCTDSSTCATGQECVKKEFFACTDYSGPSGGRGICCLKGSNCE